MFRGAIIQQKTERMCAIHVPAPALGHIRVLERIKLERINSPKCLVIDPGTGVRYSMVEVVRAF